MRGTGRMAGIAMLVLAAAASTAGEESREKAAEASARSWLALVDAGKYGESWDAAAALFRQAVTKVQWEQALQGVRAPLGRVVSRTLRGSKFLTQVPGMPDGEYVVIQFDTVFANKAGAVETITPMKDKDGAWRVSGYYIK